jgi:hypothetical protein
MEDMFGCSMTFIEAFFSRTCEKDIDTVQTTS